MVNAPTSFNNLKTKVHDWDIVKLTNCSYSLKKLTDVVDKEFIINTNINTLKTKVNNLEKKSWYD